MHEAWNINWLVRKKVSELKLKFFYYKQKTRCKHHIYSGLIYLKVGVRRLELPASSSRTTRAANCATPRFIITCNHAEALAPETVASFLPLQIYRNTFSVPEADPKYFILLKYPI